MSTCLDQINETKRYLYAGHREQINMLDGSVDDSQDTITFTQTLNSIAPSTYISIDLEIMYVWSTDIPTRTARVVRGQLGSTAAAHTGDSLVTVNPKFPDFSIMQALNASLDEMSGRGLYRAVTTTFTFQSPKYGYDLVGATDVLGQLDARYDASGVARHWPAIHDWHIRRNSDTTDFPSGFQVYLETGAETGRTVRVTYSTSFGHYIDYNSQTGDDLTTTIIDPETEDEVEFTYLGVGMTNTMLDIPPLGAALRLQGVREGQRSFNESQPDSRRSDEVPVGAQLAGTRGLKDFFDSRIQTELRRLNVLWPAHRRIA